MWFTLAAGNGALIAAIHPPTQREHDQNVLVGSPGQRTGDFLYCAGGVVGNETRRLLIEFGRTHCEQGHG